VWSLEVFQQNAAEFYPYDSKYDAYLRGQVELSVRERRGLDLFNDPQKGNCASCHPSGLKNGAHPAFTDYGFIALAVPRNRALPANRDAAFFDLGLCGPLRTDLRDRPEYCGLFRTPTLRNVALRTAFFHNGRFTTLREVLDFYAERETSPRKWYPASGYDDLPPRYAGNVEREPPFDRGKGAMPRLTKAERADIVAFLQTLTDGYSGHIAHERSR